MNLMTFNVLSGAAGAFVTYVLIQFTRVFLRARRSFGSEPGLASANAPCMESAWKLAYVPSRGSAGPQAKHELVMRKETLTCAILGAVGLLAPYVSVALFSLLRAH